MEMETVTCDSTDTSSNFSQFSSQTSQKLVSFKRKQIVLGKLVGNGAFGKVFHGVLMTMENVSVNSNISVKLVEREVAIKIPIKSPSSVSQQNINLTQSRRRHKVRNNVLYEIQLISKFKHPNLIGFIGMVENQSSTCFSLPWLIMEYIPNGNLAENFKNKINENFNKLEFCVSASLDIAQGMNYLHTEQNIVHCDLHIENCLVSETGSIKLGDFGQSFSIINEEDVLKGPIGKHGRPNIKIDFIDGARWKPPECIPGPNFKPIFTRPSDVWSYGILMYELWTGPTTGPFSELDDAQVLKALVNGKDPLDFTPSTTTKNIPSHIVILMMDCWNFSPNSRPTFSQILNVLNDNSNTSSSNNGNLICTCG